MSIYITMFIYVFIIGYLGKSYVCSRNIYTKYDSRITLFFAVLILVLPIFFIGMRTNYIDTKAYIEGFNTLPSGWSAFINTIGAAKGPGWILYEWIIKRFLTKSGNIFILFTAVIQGIAVLKLYYKYSTDYSLSVLLFFLSCSFVNMMNGIRQFLAVALILYFADYIFEKKYLKFIVIAFIACTIHISAIIWIPVIFIVQGETWNRKTILFSLIILLSIVFLDRFTGVLTNALMETSYSGYVDQFDIDDGSNFIHTLLAVIPLFIAFIGRHKIEECKDNRIKIMVNISVIGVMVSLLANFTSGILIGRMPIYFTIFNFALYPWLLDNVFYGKDKRIIRLLCILGYVGYAMYYMTHSWGSAGMPYISDILGINTWK